MVKLPSVPNLDPGTPPAPAGEAASAPVPIAVPPPPSAPVPAAAPVETAAPSPAEADAPTAGEGAEDSKAALVPTPAPAGPPPDAPTAAAPDDLPTLGRKAPTPEDTQPLQRSPAAPVAPEGGSDSVEELLQQASEHTLRLVRLEEMAADMRETLDDMREEMHAGFLDQRSLAGSTAHQTADAMTGVENDVATRLSYLEEQTSAASSRLGGRVGMLLLLQLVVIIALAVLYFAGGGGGDTAPATTSEVSGMPQPEQAPASPEPSLSEADAEAESRSTKRKRKKKRRR